MRPARAADTGMRNVTVTRDLVRCVDDDHALVEVVRHEARDLPQHRRLADARPAEQEDALLCPHEVLDDADRPEDGAPDDYRQRMTNNVLALAVCLLLVAIGIWLANSIADLRKKQDCVLSGRRDCANVSVPPADPK